MTDRRTFLKGVTALPATALLATQPGCTPAGPLADNSQAEGRDWFGELNVRPFVNAAAAYSALGGRNMWPAVVDAMEYARNQNVIMDELQEAVGRRLAELIGCEAAMVTGGATSSMTLGTAACITGTDVELISRVPDIAGLKNEVIIKRSHRNGYDHGVRNAGVRFVEVDTADQLERSITDKTVMMFFVSIYEMREPVGVGLEEFAALGQKHGIPTMIDGSNTVPPLGRLSEYLESGFDLACFSGGKGLRGPYSAGMLLGREDLIAAALLNATPNADAVGRGMKVSKEELLGMLAAVEFSQQYDYSVENVRETALVDLIAEKLSVFPGLTSQVSFPTTEGGRPHLQIFWDKSDIPVSIDEARQALQDGEPSIRTPYLELSDGQLEVGTAMLKDHEVDVVVRRIGEVLVRPA
jgi:D-glucosaminate-6-phosphate ammonia-lyase